MILRRILLGLAILILSSVSLAPRFSKQPDHNAHKQEKTVPNIVVVKFNPGVTDFAGKFQPATGVLSLLEAQGITSLDPLIRDVRLMKRIFYPDDLSRTYYATFSADKSPSEVAAALARSPLIAYAEPQYLHYINDVPNDSLYHLQQTCYTLIGLPDAWNQVKGENGQVIIAVIDGGTDIDHPDLASNIWINESELNGMQGIDDDGNGYTDDLYGWNFSTGSGDPSGLSATPFNADHGTYTAGIVSAVSNNVTGVAGVSWNARIMAVNAGSETEDRVIKYGYQGIIYAAMNGADVINCSWSSTENDTGSHLGKDAINFAASMGAVVIGAAGNEGNIDPQFPASLEKVLAVAATDTLDHLWELSNYGPEIDLAAPGVDIFSLKENKRYGYASGTSSAAPMVSGVTGLVKTLYPGWSGLQAGEQVRVSADSLTLAGMAGKGRINAHRALTEISPSIRFLDYHFTDENDNHLVEPGERIQLNLQMINYLAPATNIKIDLSTDSPYVTFIRNELLISELGTLEQTTPAEPFVFIVAKNVYGNPLLRFDLKISADGYEDTDRFYFKPIYVIKDEIWTKYDYNPLLKRGKSGEWDDLSVSVCAILYDSSASQYKMWYQGTQQIWYGDMGYATSTDGINWAKYKENPVLRAGTEEEWDARTAGMACVLKEENGGYRMWYAGSSGQATISIGYATSDDGIHWLKYEGNPVLEVGLPGEWDESWVMFPCVLFDGSLYKMWYAGYSGIPVTFENWQGNIGYATSDDGINWHKYKNNPVLKIGTPADWDHYSVTSPFVLRDDGIFHMWYSASPDGFDVNIGHATSPDGINWLKDSGGNPVLTHGSSLEWDYPTAQNPRVIKMQDTYQMWYSGGNFFSWQVGYATSPAADISDLQAVHVEPGNYLLLQNYPNPFNALTTIIYHLSETSNIDLSVYDILGQKVQTLASGRKPAGRFSVRWNAAGFASGIYFYYLKTGKFHAIKKMILIR